MEVSVALHLLIILIQISLFKGKIIFFQTMFFCGNLCYFQKVGKG